MPVLGEGQSGSQRKISPILRLDIFVPSATVFEEIAASLLLNTIAARSLACIGGITDPSVQSLDQLPREKLLPNSSEGLAVCILKVQ